MRLLITADWHLRDDKPRCRPINEDWYKFQRNCLLFIYSQAASFSADGICICGDIFHTPKVSSKILNLFLEFALNYSFCTYILPGQHDLLYHNLDTISDTSYGVLHALACMDAQQTNIRCLNEIGKTAPFGSIKFNGVDSGLYFTHRLTFPVKNFFKNGEFIGDIIEELPLSAKYFFVGDNHKNYYESFCRYKDSFDNKLEVLCISPGCLNRQSYDLHNYSPVIYLVDTDTNDYNKICISNNIYEENIELIEDIYKKKENEFESFIDIIKNVEMKNDLSFTDLLIEYIKKNEFDKECINFIKSMIEKVGK